MAELSGDDWKRIEDCLAHLGAEDRITVLRGIAAALEADTARRRANEEELAALDNVDERRNPRMLAGLARCVPADLAELFFRPASLTEKDESA